MDQSSAQMAAFVSVPSYLKNSAKYVSECERERSPHFRRHLMVRTSSPVISAHPASSLWSAQSANPSHTLLASTQPPPRRHLKRPRPAHWSSSQPASSSPSEHCHSPSHRMPAGRQRPSAAQAKCSSGQPLSVVHPASSSAFGQSFLRSQRESEEMQWPVEHRH